MAAKRFEQSPEFVPSPPGEPIEWLKYKYRAHKPISRGKTNASGNNRPKRNKRVLTPAERARHEAQPHKVKVMDSRGHCHMEIQERPSRGT